MQLVGFRCQRAHNLTLLSSMHSNHSEGFESSKTGCQHSPTWKSENTTQMAKPLDYRLRNTVGNFIRTLQLASFEMGCSGFRSRWHLSDCDQKSGGLRPIGPGHQCTDAHSR
jgi:hypothetical protein